jgi:hypothetical protein
MTPVPRLFALTLLLVLSLASPAAAADHGAALFGGYWQQFLEFWKGMFQKQNGVVMGVLCVGAVALFIITRGKWQK